ncbi:uncharacterized protein LOC118557954 [Fundulus heteroclitus]|uniref:uncharacterized protein LOC118557954 n=1 Tax=Fundulus heteroclitus TaxID=8078 RepID=UPI00165CA540|nr:uncharacterized protein LOC118557954 [Fundulus heteroclitus]
MGCRAAAAWPLRLPALSTRTLAALRPGASAALWTRRNLKVQAAGEQAGKLKSVADLPGPSWSTTLYWLFVKGYADRGHLLQAADDWAVLSAGVQHQRDCGDGFKRKRLTAPLRQRISHLWWTAPNHVNQRSRRRLHLTGAVSSSQPSAPIRSPITGTPPALHLSAVSGATTACPAALTSSLRPQSPAVSAHSSRRFVFHN